MNFIAIIEPLTEQITKNTNPFVFVNMRLRDHVEAAFYTDIKKTNADTNYKLMNNTAVPVTVLMTLPSFLHYLLTCKISKCS